MRHPQRDRGAMEVKHAIEASLSRPAGFWAVASRSYGGDDAS